MATIARKNTKAKKGTAMNRAPKKPDESTYSGRFAARLRMLREKAMPTADDVVVAMKSLVLAAENRNRRSRGTRWCHTPWAVAGARTQARFYDQFLTFFNSPQRHRGTEAQ